MNGAFDHFLADLDFLGVLAPPFFLGVLKSLSQTSHTQRPGETVRKNKYKMIFFFFKAGKQINYCNGT